MHSLKVLLCATLGTLAFACSSSSSSSDIGGAATDAATTTADAGLSSDEMDTFQSGSNSLTVNEQINTLADNLFDFDPTLNPRATPATNAAAIAANASANLGTSCGKVSVSGADVTVNFGAPPGCTLQDGTVVSGTVGLAVSSSGGTTTVALTLTSVVVNGEALAGTASYATSNGSTFTVKTDLTSGTKVDVASLTVVGAMGSYTISGTATTTEAGETTALTFTGLSVTKGQCYASAGTIGVTEGKVSETLTFNAETPSTGQVSLTVGKHTSTTTLVAYGSCPSDASASDAGRVGPDSGREGGPSH